MGTLDIRKAMSTLRQKIEGPDSPYLRRPLRTLKKARADIAKTRTRYMAFMGSGLAPGSGLDATEYPEVAKLETGLRLPLKAISRETSH